MIIFTKTRLLYDEVRRRSSEGVINWNRSTVGASGRLPFGGTGKSVNFRAAALHSVRYCTYPVASMEDGRSGVDGLTALPGILAPGSDE